MSSVVVAARLNHRAVTRHCIKELRSNGEDCKAYREEARLQATEFHRPTRTRIPEDRVGGAAGVAVEQRHTAEVQKTAKSAF